MENDANLPDRGEKPDKPKIKYFRALIQLISFFLVNYVIFEVLFATSLYMLEGWVKVLPFIQTPRDGWSTGAGILEYMAVQLSQSVFPYLLLGAVILLGLFGGRIFCGWACPVGTIQDIVAKIPQKEKRNRRFSISTDRSLKKVKLAVLATILIIVIPIFLFAGTNPNRIYEYKEQIGDLAKRPVSVFSLSDFIFSFFPSLFKRFVEDPTSNPFFETGWVVLRLFVYVVILIISAYYPRFYCRSLCPYGALLGLFSEYSLVRLGRNPVKCPGRKQCGVCEQVCPVQIRILDEPWQGFTGGGECILCLKCKEKCPHKAIEWRFG
ncbi:MAG: 4Fe-4S binding protein [Promethearchaeota archaeon]